MWPGLRRCRARCSWTRGVRSLTALRSLRCLALEVYQNVAMDGLVCLSVITQVTQLQARAFTTLFTTSSCACKVFLIPAAGHSASSQPLINRMSWVRPVPVAVCVAAVHAADAGPAAATERLDSLDSLQHSASVCSQVQCTQLKLDLPAADAQLRDMSDLQLLCIQCLRLARRCSARS